VKTGREQHSGHEQDAGAEASSHGHHHAGTWRLTIVLCALLASCATVDTFQEFDADEDGVISRTEASTSRDLDALFGSADDNGDGHLDDQEYALAEKAISGSRKQEKRRLMSTEKGGIKR
jgi:hypothetical protein